MTSCLRWSVGGETDSAVRVSPFEEQFLVFSTKWDSATSTKRHFGLPDDPAWFCIKEREKVSESDSEFPNGNNPIIKY